MTTQPQPQSIHDLYTFYLSHSHLTEDKPRTVTISQAVIKDVYNDKLGKEKPEIVIHFSDARRSLKCNKTQVEAMWEITGTDDFRKWAGNRVTLTKKPTKRGGKFTIEISKPQE